MKTQFRLLNQNERVVLGGQYLKDEREGEEMKLPKRFIVNVTARDIAGGKRNSCMECPVALAIDRALRIKTSIVGTIAWMPWLGYDGALPKLPNKATRWIHAFDSFGDCKPFRFTCST